MQTSTPQHGQTVIVGLGLTGLSCARYLAGRGESFTVVDSRAQPPGLARLRQEFPQVPVELGGFNTGTLSRASELLVSPGVDLRTPALRAARAAGVAIRGDVDLFARKIEAPVVAVTGSNAKSTVVSLLGEMARHTGVDAGLGGNIGTPVLDLLAQARKALYIVELSSFQLETTSDLGAEVATVLNMSADHMDRYDSMQSYHRAKHRIFQGARQVVVNRDDPLSEPLVPAAVKRWSFGLSRPDLGQFGLLERDGEVLLAYEDEELLQASELRIAGRHNIANALAALALGRAAGLGFEPMLAALREFPGLAHRCQWVDQRDGVQFYNDSKGTNVGASIAAIEGLAGKGRVILLAGGVGKGADFSALAAPLGRHGRLAVLFGEAAGALAAVLAPAVEVVRADSLAEAVTAAAARARPGDVVLLSPACASFDMFTDYRERGEAFMHAVKELH